MSGSAEGATSKSSGATGSSDHNRSSSSSSSSDNKKAGGNGSGSEETCCPPREDDEEGKSTTTAAGAPTSAMTTEERRAQQSSAASAQSGSVNFTIKPTAATTAGTTAAAAAAAATAGAASAAVTVSPISNAGHSAAELRGRSNSFKSRHAVRFSTKGTAEGAGWNQPGDDDPPKDRHRKHTASPPPAPVVSLSPDPKVAAVERTPDPAAAAATAAPGDDAEAPSVPRKSIVHVSEGDGLSRIGTRSPLESRFTGRPRSERAVAAAHSEDRSLRDRRVSAPGSTTAASPGGAAAVARASVKKGWGPRQRAVAEAAAAARGEGGGGDGADAPGAAAGTFMHQSRLPKLEIPPLGDTLARYLAAVAPLLSKEAFLVTKGVVKEFETSGEGEALQRSLVKYSEGKDSYVEEFWDDSYLTPKSSVVLNLNPFFVFETPTLSTHSQDFGEDSNGSVSAAAAGDRGRCPSCNTGALVGRPRPRVPQAREAGRWGGGGGGGGEKDDEENDSSPSLHSSRRARDPSKAAAAAAAVEAAAAAGKTQARRAASLLYSSLRFASAVRSETLPPDLWRDTPLCMAQYRRLFGAHRKAVENDPDEMRVCEDSRHVVVLCKNQFYCFSGLHADGRVGITEEGLNDIIVAVQEDAAQTGLTDTAAQAVGALTTQTRDEWAVARRRLAAVDESNKRYLQLVDTALFVLCLDHTSPSTAGEIAASCLHGSYALAGDVQVGTCTNRWYDKLQLIVFENGAAGVNFEHTWVDGHTVLRFASDVFADVIYRFANHLTSTTGGARGRDRMGEVFPPDKKAFSLCEGRTPVKMEWRLPRDLRRDIYFAETRISDLVRQHDVQALEYHTFGKRFITSNKMSPDAFVQMAIVYGYYGLYGDVVAAYEPVLTKAFLKGRTEALRTVTAEVKSFLEAFCNPDIPVKRKMLSLRSAIVSHGRLVKLAAKGKGIDRHLFALLCIAKKKKEDAEAAAAGMGDGSETSRPGRPPPLGTPPQAESSAADGIPALFEDEAWRTLNHVILSTSNCGNPSLRLFGFGPVVRDGFGVGYIIKENELKLVVTSKNRQTDRFVGKIREFFDTVHDAYNPIQVQRRVRVVTTEDGPDETGGSYSMWGSFINRGDQPLI